MEIFFSVIIDVFVLIQVKHFSGQYSLHTSIKVIGLLQNNYIRKCIVDRKAMQSLSQKRGILIKLCDGNAAILQQLI